MAKGGFRGMPGGMNQAAMMKQAQKMQHILLHLLGLLHHSSLIHSTGHTPASTLCHYSFSFIVNCAVLRQCQGSINNQPLFLILMMSAWALPKSKS